MNIAGIVFVIFNCKIFLMKQFLFLIISATLLLASCGSSKETTDYEKVDKSFEEFKDRNPDKD
jgi:hypothetical protein